MSTTKTKQELIRMAWITALRQQGERQCRIAHSRGRQVCAFALLAEVMGRPTDEWGTVHQEAGLSDEQACAVVCMNDGGTTIDTRVRYEPHTFAEIADVVEGWFKEGAG